LIFLKNLPVNFRINSGNLQKNIVLKKKCLYTAIEKKQLPEILRLQTK